MRTDPIHSHEKNLGLCPDTLWLCQSSAEHTPVLLDGSYTASLALAAMTVRVMGAWVEQV